MDPIQNPESASTPARKFDGAVVVSFESRNGKEMARLVEKQNGRPMAAPSMREVPLEDQHEAFEFAQRLMNGEVDTLVLLTGVGLRALLDAISTQYPREEVVRRLGTLQLICRGPKPQLVLKELGLVPALVAPEPNTTEILIATLDERGVQFTGKRVEIQEYGERNELLAEALRARGAQVRSVAVYMWQLPQDRGPLENAIREIAAGTVDLALFTSARQIVHIYQVAEELSLAESLHQALQQRVVLASIGPVTTDALRAKGLEADIEPPHPKMGSFVTHVASEWLTLRHKKMVKHT